MGVEQADGIKNKEIFVRVKLELMKRLQLLLQIELNDENLMQAINSKVFRVAAYPMNVKFSKSELCTRYQIIKTEMGRHGVLGQ